MHAAELSGVHVIAVVKRDDQVAAARHFGAKSKSSRSRAVADPIAAARALTPEARGADIVIEAVATPATWEWAVAMVRKGGVVNFFGGPPSGTTVALDTNRLHYGDITLKASFHHTPAACRRRLRPHHQRHASNAADFITGTPLSTTSPPSSRRMLTRSAEHRHRHQDRHLPQRRVSDERRPLTNGSPR